MEIENLQQIMTDFYEDLKDIIPQDSTVTFTPPTLEMAQAGQENGVPLAVVCPPRIDPLSFFNLLEKVAKAVREHHPDLTDDLNKIVAVLPVDPSGQEAMVTKLFKTGVRLVEEINDVNSDTFTFLLNHTLKPFLQIYAKKVVPFYNMENWLKGICPVCASKPYFARLEKEYGARYLYCSLCDTQWRFDRLTCPFCNENKSQYFTIEGLEKYRVYFCDNCRGYIKTLDEKKSGIHEANLFWEDVGTVQLDIMAMSEGYFNKLANHKHHDEE